MDNNGTILDVEFKDGEIVSAEVEDENGPATLIRQPAYGQGHGLFQ